jgi:pimeloyl-ACP methyl ester carboxylesterase
MGTGFSDRPPDLDCSFRASAQRLLRFMDATGIASCDLLGTSHGGAVSMMLAALASKRIRRLILVDPVNPWSAHGKHLSVLLSNPVVAPMFLTLAPRVRILDEFYHRRMFGDPRRIPPDSLEGYRKPMRIPGSYEYGLAVLRSWNRDLRELESVLPLIADIPTLLTWGTLDTAVDPASAQQLQQRFRDCRLLKFEGVGHLPYEEAPEEFNRAVIAFLSSNSH